VPASSPQLLTDIETCPRKGFYSRAWASQRIPAREMVIQALRTALTATEPLDGAFGEVAGAECLQLAEDRGLKTEQQNVYAEVMHNAALSDILVSSIRKPADEPWINPPNVQGWTSDCLMSPDGKFLRRLCLVSHWNDQRHYSECRSWYSIGEIAHYKLPMQMIVLVIGQERSGKRSTPWTQGFLHPQNRILRFRKKSRSTSEIFNDKWEKVYREDHAEISRETWLNAMLKDDVLPEVCFKVDIPVPDETHLQRVRDMAARKMERLQGMTEKPEANLSSCDWPTPCVFRNLCHTLPEREPSGRNGFVRIEPIVFRQAALECSRKSA
jgi:hypothetical protein